MQFGTAMALYSIASMLSSHILAILQSSENIYVCRDYLFHLADIESQDVEMSGELEMGDFASLALHDVSFRYGNEMKNAISNINLSIEKGQKVAIIGSSGSGKSTLAKVLVKLYAPTTGEILINDTNVNELDNQSLRKRIVMVPQTGRIFNKTIKDNIFLDSSMEGESIETLLEMVCLTDDISNMAMRYNTTLSENGANISGGQRQKILIARALASCPQVLVLDEATCAMDYLSEKKIYENLKKRSITQIIITHRLNTIIDADEIYVMEKGELVEHGNHEELMQMQGTYYRLYSEGNE